MVKAQTDHQPGTRFGSTYEGLKLVLDQLGERVLDGFGSTYEGLKHKSMGTFSVCCHVFWQYL